jgi:hypothetical protein
VDAEGGAVLYSLFAQLRRSSIADLAKESPQKLADRIVRQRFVVEENERAIAVLRQALEHQRKINGSMTLKFQKELDQRLRQQKDEYDATVVRHQSFIDQVSTAEGWGGNNARDCSSCS